MKTSPRPPIGTGLGPVAETERAAAPHDKTAARTAGVLLLVALALRLGGILSFRFDSDESQHAHVAWGWTRGLLQYRDLFDNHTPLFHMLTAPLLAVAGETPAVLFWLRLWMLPLYAAAVAGIYLLGRHLYAAEHREAARWAAVLTALLPPFLWKTLEFRTDVMWAALWVATLAVLLTGPLGARRGLAAGLLLGTAAAVSLKTVMLAVALVAGALVSLAIIRPTPGELRRWVAAAAAGLGGFLVAPLGVAAYFASRGGLSALAAGAVGHNLLAARRGLGLPARALIFCLGVPLLLAAARRTFAGARGDPRPRSPERRGRLLLLLATGFYLIGVWAFWPIVASQTYLPAEPPLILLFTALLFGRFSSRGIGRALAATLLLELVFCLAQGVRGRGTSPEPELIGAALRLTARADRIFDLKGETVFRRRAYFPVLETITRDAIAAGKLADTIPEDIAATHTCVAIRDTPRIPPRGRAFLNANFLPVGLLRVCGRMLARPAGGGPPGTPVPFEISLPERYVLMQPAGPAQGLVDGREIDGPLRLAAGRHVFVPRPSAEASGPFALVWEPAVARGFSPFGGAAPGGVGVRP